MCGTEDQSVQNYADRVEHVGSDPQRVSRIRRIVLVVDLTRTEGGQSADEQGKQDDEHEHATSPSDPPIRSSRMRVRTRSNLRRVVHVDDPPSQQSGNQTSRRSEITSSIGTPATAIEMTRGLKRVALIRFRPGALMLVARFRVV